MNIIRKTFFFNPSISSICPVSGFCLLLTLTWQQTCCDTYRCRPLAPPPSSVHKSSAPLCNYPGCRPPAGDSWDCLELLQRWTCFPCRLLLLLLRRLTTRTPPPCTGDERRPAAPRSAPLSPCHLPKPGLQIRSHGPRVRWWVRGEDQIRV